MSIQVDGSGTGVKFRVRVSPVSPTAKLPPPVEFWKFVRSTEKSAELKVPRIGAAVRRVHVYDCDELKLAGPVSDVPGSIDSTAILKGVPDVALIVRDDVRFNVS
jgi:hypothetical protein